MDEGLFRLFPFLGEAAPLVRRELEETGRRVHLAPGQRICGEGDRCAHLALVLSGGARVYKIGETGREITLYRIEPGESCILTASCILSNLEFPAHAEVESEMEALLVPARTARHFIHEDEAWRRYVFDLLSRRLATVIAVLEEVVFRRLDARLAGHLVSRCHDGPGTLVAETHEIIASELGSSREVISRLLKELERDGLVELRRGGVLVRDLEGLRARSE